MGWGDEIIATGQARRMYEIDGRKCVIVDRTHRPRWHEAWENNPHIVKSIRASDMSRYNVIVNGPGHRPYIAAKLPTKWEWREWDCPVGVLNFTDLEVEWAEMYSGVADIIIEPNLKAKASPNKDWSFARWCELLLLLRARGYTVAQMGPAGTRLLPGARFIQTPTMRHASAVLRHARLAVLPEGGLHHSAAAVGLRAIVLYGGYISPKQTGYDLHFNVFTADAACGSRIDCDHCREAMGKITPDYIVDTVDNMMKGV